MWWATSTILPTAAPVMFNFMPSWWYREYGISYGERIFFDPEYRANTQREMSRLMYERFGDVGLGDLNPSLVYSNDDLLNATMPAVLGCEVIYQDDKYPANLPLNEEKTYNLRPPVDITEAFPMKEIIRQTRYINERHGQNLLPGWGCMGIQNIAVRTRGSDFFVDYYANPELSKKILDISRDLMVSSIDYFFSIGANVGLVWNQNCTVPLVGPKIYEGRLLSYEHDLYSVAESYGCGYGIHHCGNFDDYASLYRQIRNLAWIEIGWGSDLRLALDTFPEAKVQYIISYQLVQNGPASVIRDTMRSLMDIADLDIGRISFNTADLEYGTPDENVRAVIEGLLPKG